MSCKINPISDKLYTSQGELITLETFINQRPNISQASTFNCTDYNNKMKDFKDCKIESSINNDQNCSFKIVCSSQQNR